MSREIDTFQKLFAVNPALNRSIRHSFPYIDLENHLQIELIAATRPDWQTNACSAASRS
jgi:phosphoenolpyruvate carboxylase